MIKKLATFLKYPISFKWLLVVALAESAKNEFFLRLNIYKPIKHLHQNISDDDKPELSEEEIRVLLRIAKAMKLLEKFAPWKPKCYNRALTAKKLLAKRKIDSNLHIGFRKKDGKYDGHAWITYRGKFVTGFLPGIKTFKELEPVE